MNRNLGQHWRHAVFQVGASWLFTIGFALFSSGVAIATLGRFSLRLTPILMRVWGRTMLWIAGVSVELEGREHLVAPIGKVVVFNHSSMLDAFVIAATCPRASVAAIKREVLFFPGFGLAIYFLRFLIIDRGNTERARKALDREARRIAAEQLTVFLAPEGTRTRDGRLLPFKRGAFHLAVASGAPIVPMLLRGNFERHPYGSWWSVPGGVTLTLLAPISTRGLTAADVPALSERVQGLMQQALAQPSLPTVEDRPEGAAPPIRATEP